MKSSELIVSLFLGGTLVVSGVTGTLYVSEKGPFDPAKAELESVNEVGPTRYELADAFDTCRSRVPSAIPYKVRNLQVDHRSSHFEKDVNKHQVFLNLEVIEQKDKGLGYDAQISCQVSASNNKVTSFRIRKL